MSEITDTAAAETVVVEQPASETGTDWKAEAEKWKALSRKNEERAKAAEPAAQKLAALEEAQKSELEKAQARADAAEKAVATESLARLRAQVALDKKLTPSQAKRLVGSTQEELEADAEELLADLKNSKPAAAPSSDGQGKQGDPIGGVKQLSLADLESMSPAEVQQARRDGRLDTVLGKTS